MHQAHVRGVYLGRFRLLGPGLFEGGQRGVFETVLVEVAAERLTGDKREVT